MVLDEVPELLLVLGLLELGLLEVGSFDEVSELVADSSPLATKPLATLSLLDVILLEPSAVSLGVQETRPTNIAIAKTMLNHLFITKPLTLLYIPTYHITDVFSMNIGLTCGFLEHHLLFTVIL